MWQEGGNHTSIWWKEFWAQEISSVSLRGRDEHDMLSEQKETQQLDWKGAGRQTKRGDERPCGPYRSLQWGLHAR